MASIGTPPTTAKEHLPALRHSGVRNTADHTITEHMRVEKKDVKTDSNMKTAYYYGGNNYNYGGNNYGGNNYGGNNYNYGGNNYGGNNYNYGGNNYNYGGSYYSSYSDRYCSYWSYGSEYSSYCGYLDYQPSCCGSSCCAQGYDYCTSNNECSMYDNSYNDYYCEGTYCGYLDHQPSCCGITCCADGYDYCNEYNECAMASTYDSRYCEGTYCGYLDHQPTCCGANCCAVGYDYCNEYNECSTSSTYDNRYCDGTYCGYLAYQPSCCGGTCCSEGYNYCNEYNECSMSSTYDYRYCEGSYCGYLAYQPSCCGSACCAEGYNFCNQYNECAMRTYEYRYCEGSYCGFLDYQPGCCGNICCSTDTAWCNEHNECVEGYYFPTMQPTRMSRDATEKMRRKIGKSASDNALAKTMHKSGVFVANAIRSAGLDFPERYDVQPGEFGPLMQGELVALSIVIKGTLTMSHSGFCEAIQVLGIRSKEDKEVVEAFCTTAKIKEPQMPVTYLTLQQFKKAYLMLADIEFEMTKRHIKYEKGAVNIMAASRNRERLLKILNDQEQAYMNNLGVINDMVENVKRDRRLKHDTNKREAEAIRDKYLHDAEKFIAVRGKEKRVQIKQEQEEKSRKRVEAKVLKNQLARQYICIVFIGILVTKYLFLIGL
jgi:hypothetical protein